MSDLRSEVEALENTASSYTPGAFGQESMRSRVLRLIPEGSVVVTEEALAEALYAVHSWEMATAQSEASAVFAALTRHKESA